jgi:hypothetical protein
MEVCSETSLHHGFSFSAGSLLASHLPREKAITLKADTNDPDIGKRGSVLVATQESGDLRVKRNRLFHSQ